jgi:hypothetical protein
MPEAFQGRTSALQPAAYFVGHVVLHLRMLGQQVPRPGQRRPHCLMPRRHQRQGLVLDLLVGHAHARLLVLGGEEQC